MARKTEIKVYLPERLVGELEGRKRMGTRSKFIEQAIQDKLKKLDSATLQDYNPIAMLCFVRDNHYAHIPLIHDLLQLIVNEVNKK